jgi:hypothetical protein
LILILLVFGKSLLGFHTDNEKAYLPPFLLDYLTEERFKLFRIDAIKAFIYVAITVILLFLCLKKKLNQNIALIIIGAVSLFDLWTVNKRYLNDDNYVDKILLKILSRLKVQIFWLKKFRVILIWNLL